MFEVFSRMNPSDFGWLVFFITVVVCITVYSIVKVISERNKPNIED